MLINKLNSGITLKIVDAKGKKDSVNIQPKGRINLPAGWTLDPVFVQEYKALTVDTDASRGGR